MMPPGRRSTVQWVTLKPFGPHHCFKRSASVHAFHTRSRGASKTRLMMNSSVFSTMPPPLKVHQDFESAVDHPLGVEGHRFWVHHVRQARVFHDLGVDA